MFMFQNRVSSRYVTQVQYNMPKIESGLNERK